jgi:hypothetical protein
MYRVYKRLTESYLDAYFSYSSKDYDEGDIVSNSYDLLDADNYTEVFLEYFRPEDKPVRRNCVFMFTHKEEHRVEEYLDFENDEYKLLELDPLSTVYKFSHTLSSDIYMYCSENEIHNIKDYEDNPIKYKKLKILCDNYWSSKPAKKDNLWEYLTEKAEVVSISDPW